MNIVYLLGRFENEFRLDDPRTKILTSQFQKLIYSIARIEGKVSFDTFVSFYVREDVAKKSAEQLRFFGFLTELKDNYYYFIPYTETDKLLDEDKNENQHNA